MVGDGKKHPTSKVETHAGVKNREREFAQETIRQIWELVEKGRKRKGIYHLTEQEALESILQRHKKQ